VEVWPSGWQG